MKVRGMIPTALTHIPLTSAPADGQAGSMAPLWLRFRTSDFLRISVLLLASAWYALTACAGTLKFNGTTSHVLVESSITGLRFPGTNAFTIEAWVKLNSLSSFQTIVSKWNGGVAGEYHLSLNTSGTLLFQREVGPTFDLSSIGTVSTGVWTHVAVTYAAGTRRFYIPGLTPAPGPFRPA
jgi:hypothetical protein